MTIITIISSLAELLTAAISNNDRVAIVEGLQHWLRSHLQTFPQQIVTAERLDFYAGIRLADYPVSQPSQNVVDQVSDLLRRPPTSISLLAQRLSEIFWLGITFEADKDCPRCDWTLQLLHDAQKDILVYACDRCAWSADVDENAWNERYALVAATRKTLTERGVSLPESASEVLHRCDTVAEQLRGLFIEAERRDMAELSYGKEMKQAVAMCTQDQQCQRELVAVFQRAIEGSGPCVPWELVAYCLRKLRWPELLIIVKATQAEAISENNWRAINILANWCNAFDEVWEDEWIETLANEESR
jgi:hypothetical protein